MRTARLSTIVFALLEVFAFSCGGDDEPGAPHPKDASSEKASLDVQPPPPDAVEEGEAVVPTSDGGTDESEASIPDGGDADASTRCGDGVVDPGETCDDGFRDSCGACNADCLGTGDGRPHVACGCA